MLFSSVVSTTELDTFRHKSRVSCVPSFSSSLPDILPTSLLSSGMRCLRAKGKCDAVLPGESFYAIPFIYSRVKEGEQLRVPISMDFTFQEPSSPSPSPRGLGLMVGSV